MDKIVLVGCAMWLMSNTLALVLGGAMLLITSNFLWMAGIIGGLIALISNK